MLAGLANYGSDSDDGSEAGSVAGSVRSSHAGSETETEDEATPRNVAPLAPLMPVPAAAPVQPRGAKILIKPAPQVIIGDDPDEEKSAEEHAKKMAAEGGEPVDEPLEALLERFLGPAAESGGDATLQLQEKVITTLTRYHQGGQHFVDYMRTNHAFRNPEILTKLVEKMRLDQYGTEYHQDLFHPKGYKREFYIDKVIEQQLAWLHKQEEIKRKRGSIEFVPSVLEAGLQSKKSKWDSGTATAAPPASAALETAKAAAAAAAARFSSSVGAAVGAANAPPVPAGTGNPFADLMAIKQMQGAGKS